MHILEYTIEHALRCLIKNKQIEDTVVTLPANFILQTATQIKYSTAHLRLTIESHSTQLCTGLLCSLSFTQTGQNEIDQEITNVTERILDVHKHPSC